MDKQVEELIRVIDTWSHQKKAVFDRSPFEDGKNPASLREFVEINNRLSRRLISVFERTNPESSEFWQSLAELATQASTLVIGAKTFVNGQDRTSEGT